jgi:hypothetical protein
MSSYVPADLKRRVRAQFAGCCAYCRTAEALTVSTFEMEHITPISAGGTTIFENLCLACPTCNRYKSTREEVTDPETQAKAPLFHPQQERWQDHFSWSDDATEVIPLTATGRGTVVALRMNRPQLTRLRRMWVKMGEHPPAGIESKRASQ